MTMFPTHTEFELRTVDGKRILLAVTHFRCVEVDGRVVESGAPLTCVLAEVVDKEYPMPLRYEVPDTPGSAVVVEFPDLEYIALYEDGERMLV